MTQNIILVLRKQLKLNIDAHYKANNQRFFKEPVKLYGVRTSIVRYISKEAYKDLKQISKNELFDLCEQLMCSQLQEEFSIASDWIHRRSHEFKPNDIKYFKRIIEKYVSNWATCDDFCCHSVGELLFKYPDLITEIKTWSISKNKWLRRASAVSLIYSVRRKNCLKDIFDVSLNLIKDKEDLVQKAYGWALKEASNSYPKQVFDFVLKHKAQMPRTALRYAVEKLPKNLKKKAMEK
jgi:3-methyladenine DNA glycosylase AlkD